MENSDKRIYQLSLAAEDDLRLIFDYTEQEFGVAQAVVYLEGIEKLLLQLQSNPYQGRNRKEICEGLRSIPIQSHIIFYRFLPGCVWVVRVLHGSRDLPALLEKLKIESQG